MLIVDDDAATRALLRRILARDRACQVIEADNGVAALDAIGKDSFSFVLLDLEMPVMDGICTLRAIRASAEHALLPVVILTATKEERDVRAVAGLGISCYLTKPLKPAQIAARLEKLAASIVGGGGAEAAQASFLRQPALRVNLALAAQRVLAMVLGTDVTVAPAGPDADAGSGVLAGVRLTGGEGGPDVRFEVCCGMEAALRLAAAHLGRSADAVQPDELPAVFQEIAALVTGQLQTAMRQRYVALSCSPPAARVGTLTPVPAGGDRVVLYLQAGNQARIRVTLVGASATPAASPAPDVSRDSAPAQAGATPAVLSPETPTDTGPAETAAVSEPSAA